METVGKFTTSLLIIVLGVAVQSFVFMKLSGWILTPIFQLPELSLGQSFAVSVVTSFLIPKNSKEKDTGKTPFENLIIGLTKSIFICLLFLLMGWIATFFI